MSAMFYEPVDDKDVATIQSAIKNYKIRRIPAPKHALIEIRLEKILFDKDFLMKHGMQVLQGNS